jgi:hypothetical protein
MKKIIALLMAVLMMMAMVACGNTDTPSTDDGANTEVSSSDVSSNDTSSEATATVGETLLAAFKADSTGTAQEVADRLITNPIIQFMGGATPIEEGLLSGFDNTEIKGLKEGAMFAPMMSSIAFVGYIFELNDGADVEAFKTTLKDSANLRWNICVEAEELIVENEGNKVFFLMCPKSFEQPETEGDNGIADEMPAEDMIPAEDGITLE